MSYVPNLVVLG